MTYGRVLGGHGAQLQGDLVLGRVSGVTIVLCREVWGVHHLWFPGTPSTAAPPGPLPVLSLTRAGVLGQDTWGQGGHCE